MEPSSDSGITSPNRAELLFLELAYERFQSVFNAVMSDDFWRLNPSERFTQASIGFSVYAELLSYDPITNEIDVIKKSRPPMEAEICGELIKFVRNLLSHFPFFSKWDDVWISETLVTWRGPKGPKTIHNFLGKFRSHSPVKYRIWDSSKKSFDHVSINFGWSYGGDSKIYLRDIIAEREGIRFAYILMRQVLDSQLSSK